MQSLLDDFNERCAKPKPFKGSHFLTRKAKKAEIRRFEETEKAAVRVRDRVCRWPGCKENGKGIRLEVAHLNDKGIGGDHSERSSRDQMILLCYWHHQGPESLHSKDLKIEATTNDGTAGPCAFYELNRETLEWQHVFTEAK